MRTVRCGLIGVGFIGPHQVDAMCRLGFVEVAAICASRLDSARKKAEALHIPKAYGSYEELLDDPEIEVADIATPTRLHYPITMAALARRKHVIVDKPLAVSSSEARERNRTADIQIFSSCLFLVGNFNLNMSANMSARQNGCPNDARK